MKISKDDINEQNYIKIVGYIYELDKIFNETEEIQKYNFKVLQQVNRFDDSDIIEYGMIISINSDKEIYVPLPILKLKNTNLLLSTCMNQLSDEFLNKNKTLIKTLVYSLRLLFKRGAD